MSSYKKLKIEINQLQEELKIKQNDKRDLEYRLAHLEYKATNLRRYRRRCENTSEI